ncbi:Fe2+ transport system protein B [Labrenzia sp. EL_195]|nr:Fe2+ transport system protein B [Labrenzia sp. EL_195]
MYSQTSADVRREFELVLMRREAETLKQPADWDRANEIKSQYQNEVQQQNRKYYRDYDSRVAKRLKQLIDKAAGRSRNLAPRFFGTDKFDKDVLKRQAHRDVQFDHQRRITSIREREAKELGTFLQSVRERDQQKQGSAEEFNDITSQQQRKEGQQPPKPTYTRKRT